MSYQAVRRWLEEHTPLEPSLLEGAGFEMLVAERISAVGGGSEPAYVEALGRSADEVECLTAGIAVPETWFFRYPQSFRLLVDFLERRRNAGAASLRMASVGCASGEEAFSMAMAAIHAGWPDGSVRIEAFDRSRSVLRRAEAGEYSASSIRTEIPEWAAGFLRRSGTVIVVDPGVRALVRFVHADVTQPGVLSADAPFDAVFCRNLMIYLGAVARARLLESIRGALAPGGLLFVGHAEPLLCAAGGLRHVDAPHTFALERTMDTAAPVYRAPDAPPARSRRVDQRTPRTAPVPIRVSEAAQSAPSEQTIEDARALADSGRAAEAEATVKALLARHGPSAEALELLGMLRMASNDARGAKQCFEQAVYLEPSRTASLLQLAVISESNADPRRAQALWNRARRPAAGTEGDSRP